MVAPAGSDFAITVTEDAPYTFVNDFLINFSDGDGDTPTGVILTTLPSLGTIKLFGTPVMGGQFVGIGDYLALTYEPVPNANGASYTSFTFQVKDDRGVGDTDLSANTVTINVSPAADTPSVAGAITNEDTQSASGLVISRNALDGAEVTHFKITGIANGTLFLNDGTTPVANGSFITFAQGNAGLKFTPDLNFNGTGTFNVQASTSGADAGLGGGVTAANVIVSAFNDAPVNTLPGSFTTNEDTPIAFTGVNTISVSDVDAANVSTTITATGGTFTVPISALTFTTLTLPASVSSVNGALAGLVFTPNPNYSGAASLRVVTNDLGASGAGGALIDDDTIAINVIAVNDAPVANPNSYSVNEDTLLAVLTSGSGVRANDTDVETATGSLIATKLTNPSNGTLLTFGTNGTFTYLPNLNFSGTDSFTYQVSDGSAVSAPATVTITVNPVNDRPIAVPEAILVSEDGVSTSLVGGATSVLSNDIDVDSSSLTAVLVTSPANGTVVLNSNGTYTYTPNANFYGIDGFTYRANDGAANSLLPALVGIVVSPVADTASVTNAATNEDTQSASGLVISRNAADSIEVTHFKITGITNGTLFRNDGTTQINNGDFITFAQANAGLKFTPALNFNGNATFNVQSSILGNDGGLGGAVVTATIVVAPVNDAPTAPLQKSVTIDEDTSTGPVAIGASDIDGDTLTYSLAPGGEPIKGSVTFANGNFTYTPNANSNGNDAFSILVSDGNGGTTIQDVAVSIRPIDDLPVGLPDTISTTENTPVAVHVSTFLNNDYDIDGDPKVLTGVLNPTNGTVSLVHGTVTFTPTPGFSGTAGFDYTYGGLTPARVTVLVGAINDKPVASGNQSIITLVSTARVFSVTANDPDGDVLSYTAGTATFGTVAAGGGGTFTYTPAAGYVGTDSFAVTIADGRGGTAVQTVTVTVVALPAADDWRLITDSGFTGSIGGSGVVNGTNGTESITVLDLPGNVSFSGSFARGNDTIWLPGSAGRWQVVRAGSNALFSDGDTFATIPVGDGGTSIIFADGIRTLAFTGTTMTIGGQTVTDALTTVTAPLNPLAVPVMGDPNADARLIFASGGIAAIKGNVAVTGTNAVESLTVLGGEIRLDPSFSRGGETLVIPFAATGFEAERNAAVLHLTGNGLDLTIPGGNGLMLDFTDSDRLLALSATAMTIGSQTITSTSAFLIA